MLKWEKIDPYTAEVINLSRPLSVISQEEFDRDVQAGGKYDTTRSYAGMAVKPDTMSDEEFTRKNKPFEIRVLFYKDHVRQSAADPDYAKSLDQATKDLIAKYYFANMQSGRHPLVPRGENLIKLGQTQENGKDIFYFIPEKLRNAYAKES